MNEVTYKSSKLKFQKKFVSRRVIGLSLNYKRSSPREEYSKVKDGWYLNAFLFLPFKDLKSLYLPGNHIAGCVENEGFEWLSRVSNLETLDLSWNSLKNSILLHMGNLSS
ncbi:Uncharacterized protein TCM_045039 [Theobroma cacao]|uniref:Uncharacterized protein n=1 Tax=Theobroma cacao TaxID=3641 RepID=A0A061FS79_THECC|nr:Uncharacterized protein TCM_045039 [Theobroma cacao]